MKKILLVLCLRVAAPAAAQRSISFEPFELPAGGSVVAPVAAGDGPTGIAAMLDNATNGAIAVAMAEAGFPLSQASYNYLIHSGDIIFGQDPDGWAALHDADGQLLKPGDPVIIPHLAETLARLGEAGVRDF